MRSILLLCWCCSIVALAQSSSNTQTRIPDLNGGYSTEGPAYSAAKTANSASRIEYAPSINGQLVPRESVEEKVIRQDANGKVVERYIRRYDATGNPGPVEKSVIEEKRNDGTVHTTTTVYRGDLNGNLAPTERRVSQSVTQGTTTTTEVTIERAGFEGMTAAERIRSTTQKTSPASEEVVVSRLRRDTSGNFYEAVREVTEKQTAPGNVVTENRVQYVGGSLAEQTVSRTVPSPDGSAITTVDVFTPQQPGQSAESSGRLALREQQQVATQVDPKTGNVTQVVTTRKPSVSDANRLGPVQVLSQSTCAGNGCNPKN